MTDGDSVTMNHLCNSANGTFVTLDDYLPNTGYEPNAMEFTGTKEFNDAVSSDINFQDSLDYTAPSSDLHLDDDALGKLLAEVHRDCADYRRAEGASVSQITQKNKKETTIERRNPCGDSEIPKWLQEFRENLVDDEIPLQGGSHASSSHEVSLEPTTKRREDLGKHSVYTHFPQDRNCEICKKDQKYKGPMQKTQWWSRTSCYKFW